MSFALKTLLSFKFSKAKVKMIFGTAIICRVKAVKMAAIFFETKYYIILDIMRCYSVCELLIAIV